MTGDEVTIDGAHPGGAEENDDLAGRLALAVGRFNRRIRSSTGGLSHGQLSALSTIVRRAPIRPSELAGVELVAAPTITRVIADLESRGLVSRAPDPDDGRSFFVTATEQGVELLHLARSDRARAVRAVLDELSADDVQALRDALPAIETAAQVAPQRPNGSSSSGSDGSFASPGRVATTGNAPV